jgi:hypothetical protein
MGQSRVKLKRIIHNIHLDNMLNGITQAAMAGIVTEMGEQYSSHMSVVYEMSKWMWAAVDVPSESIPSYEAQELRARIRELLSSVGLTKERLFEELYDKKLEASPEFPLNAVSERDAEPGNSTD